MNMELKLPEGWDWNQFSGFFSLRAIPGVEKASPEKYVRTFQLGGDRGTFSVCPSRDGYGLWVGVSGAGPETVERIRLRLIRMFDLEADMDAVAATLSRDEALKPLMEKWPGLRLPSAFDPFEQGVRTIIGQQISVKATVTLVGRLAAKLGTRLEESATEGPAALFPGPDRIFSGDLGGLGLSKTKETAMKALAGKIISGELDLENPGDPATVDGILTSIPGIGQWTAQYFAMRALGNKDAFPSSDLGILKSRAWGGQPMTPAGILKRAENWRPYRAYAAVYLWRSYGG